MSYQNILVTHLNCWIKKSFLFFFPVWSLWTLCYQLSVAAPESNQKPVCRRRRHRRLCTDRKRRPDGCRWSREVFIYHIVINLKMQAVAVGAGSPCLVPTARQTRRHPGAISEIVHVSLPPLVPPVPPTTRSVFLLGPGRFVTCVCGAVVKVYLW